MTELELEAMIQRAAEAGAKKALRDVGLQDDDAVHDMREDTRPSRLLAVGQTYCGKYLCARPLQPLS
jgi:hypothetical protein